MKKIKFITISLVFTIVFTIVCFANDISAFAIPGQVYSISNNSTSNKTDCRASVPTPDSSIEHLIWGDGYVQDYNPTIDEYYDIKTTYYSNWSSTGARINKTDTGHTSGRQCGVESYR